MTHRWPDPRQTRYDQENQHPRRQQNQAPHEGRPGQPSQDGPCQCDNDESFLHPTRHANRTPNWHSCRYEERTPPAPPTSDSALSGSVVSYWLTTFRAGPRSIAREIVPAALAVAAWGFTIPPPQKGRRNGQ